MFTLYDYYRSTACYRVRIALNYKNLPYQTVPIHLIDHGGEQYSKTYQQINPQQLVPTLSHESEFFRLSQSLAILDYLEDIKPSPSLYPLNIALKALAKSIALTICCDIHPLNNLRVLTYLKEKFKVNDKAKLEWYHHWLMLGFDAIESNLQQIERTRAFCINDELSIADICLIPQVYNALRFDFDLTPYPIIQSINEHCLTLDVFKAAQP